jgi:hypothetical protein
LSARSRLGPSALGESTLGHPVESNAERGEVLAQSVAVRGLLAQIIEETNHLGFDTMEQVTAGVSESQIECTLVFLHLSSHEVARAAQCVNRGTDGGPAKFEAFGDTRCSILSRRDGAQHAVVGHVEFARGSLERASRTGQGSDGFN